MSSQEIAAPPRDAIAPAHKLVYSQVIGRALELTMPTNQTAYEFYGQAGILEHAAAASLLKLRDKDTGGHRIFEKDDTAHGGTLYRGAASAIIGAVAAQRGYGASRSALTVTAATDAGFGYAVAEAASMLNVDAVVYTTKDIDRLQLRALLGSDADVITGASNLDDAATAARRTAELLGGFYIHSANHIDVMGGLATVGQELVAGVPQLSRMGIDPRLHPIKVMVPIVEGGLAAALACVAQRARDKGYIGRNVQLVAALPPGSPALSDRTFSNLAHPIITDEQNYPQEIEVGEAQLRQAAGILGARHQKVISRSGALSLAAALTYAQECPVSPGRPQETLITITTEALPD